MREREVEDAKDYSLRLQRYHEECERIRLKWDASHTRRYLYLGDKDGRITIDPQTGLKCMLAPLYPEWPAEPSAPEAFDPDLWQAPVEAPRD